MRAMKVACLLGICLLQAACGQQQTQFLGEDIEVLESRMAEAEKSDWLGDYFPYISEDEPEAADWMNLVYSLVRLAEGEKRQTVEASITYAIKERMQDLHPELNMEDEGVLHRQIEELLAGLDTLRLWEYADDMSQIHMAVYIPEMLNDYRAEYYARLIRERITKEALPLWTAYYDSFEDYLSAYLEVGDSVIVGTFGGSGGGMGFTDAFIRMRMEDMRDFAYSLLDTAYVPTGRFRRIPDKDMHRFYEEIYMDWKTFPDEMICNGVSTKGSIDALRKEEEYWFRLMDKRLPVYRLLKGKQKECFAHSTNRMQKRHAVQIRNRFQGYGVINEELCNRLLPPDCSYERLYDYRFDDTGLR